VRVQNAESSNASFKHKSNAASPSATDDDDGLLETLESLERLLVRRTTKAKLLLSKALMAGQSTSEDYRARLTAAITSVHGSANLVHGTYTIETPAPPPSGAEATNITVRHATERGRTIKVQFDLGTTEFHSRRELGLAPADECNVGSRVRLCALRRVRAFGRVPMPNASGAARNPGRRQCRQDHERHTRRDPPLRLPLQG
jgi:hypothetical protein